jgi:hypothetical protein
MFIKVNLHLLPAIKRKLFFCAEAVLVNFRRYIEIALECNNEVVLRTQNQSNYERDCFFENSSFDQIVNLSIRADSFYYLRKFYIRWCTRE